MRKQIFAVSRRLLALALALALLLPLGTIQADALNAQGFAGGSGTKEDPFLVADKDQLNRVRYQLGSYFKQTKDIVFTAADYAQGGDYYNSGMGWEPIGTATAPFQGRYDGAGHKISGMQIRHTTGDSADLGLFGYVKEFAIIENLDLANAVLDINLNEEGSAGVLVGVLAYSTVQNCHVSGSVTGWAQGCVGGIVGKDIPNDPPLFGNSYISVIQDSRGDVDLNVQNSEFLTTARVGGITGSSQGRITNVIHTGKIICTGFDNEMYVGGIAGFGGDSITGAINTGSIRTTVEDVNHDSYVGGIVGYSGDSLKDCHNWADITTTTQTSTIGGIAGNASDRTHGGIVGCSNRGDITGGCIVGGLIGYNGCKKVANCYNTGKITGTIGETEFKENGSRAIGGLIGNHSYNSGALTECFNLGDVSYRSAPEALSNYVNLHVGGLVAYCGSDVSDCYNAGKVTVQSGKGNQETAYAGGLIGNLDSGTVNNCYNVGKVSISTTSPNKKPAAGAVGFSDEGTVTNCYYLNTTGTGTGRPLKEADMHYAFTFGSLDFEKIWTMEGNADYAYPELRNTLLKTYELKITQQPQNAGALAGKPATTTVKAVGDGVKYEWYIKNKTSGKYVKSSAEGPVYSVPMNESRHGRWVKCKITDLYGNVVWSRTASLTLKKAELKITAQPQNAKAAEGKTAVTVVKAQGEGLKYEWYIKNKTSGKYVKSSAEGPVYSVPMNASRHGRWVKCKITDAYGQVVWSRTASLTMVKDDTLRIIAQPHNVTAAEGQTASVTVKAAGKGLQYTWYVKNPGSDKYLRSSVHSATYAVPMTAARNGRLLKCKITDSLGNTLWANTVRISMK